LTLGENRKVIIRFLGVYFNFICDTCERIMNALLEATIRIRVIRVYLDAKN
jgi:NMD protein affecting ribosome stability and mRNA decay